MEEFHRRVINTGTDTSMLTRFFDQTHLYDRSISRLYDFFTQSTTRACDFFRAGCSARRSFAGISKISCEMNFSSVGACMDNRRALGFQSQILTKARFPQKRQGKVHANEVRELDRPAAPHQRQTIFPEGHQLECRIEGRFHQWQRSNYCQKSLWSPTTHKG